MMDLYSVEGIIAEPAGALASAAVAAGLVLPTGPAICVLSGGNNDLTRYSEVQERALVYKGLRHYFLVNFPQTPGALRHFLDDVLGPDDDIVLFDYIKRSNREVGPALVGIEIDQPESLPALIERMKASPLDIEVLPASSPILGLLV